MVRSCVTVSLVNEARGGPFVFWDDLEPACRTAAELGFDAVEVFAPGPETVDREQLQSLLSEHGLSLAAVGTGAGWVIRKLHLCSPVTTEREAAREFIRGMVDFGGPFGAPAIIGSMQGRFGGDVSRDTALEYLAEALNELGEHARQYNVPLIYEPLNRYETNLICTLADGVQLLEGLETDNVKLLADLFHMNIEERDLGEALREAGAHVGHLHFVDSNRQAAGRGHLDFAPVVAALRETGYNGYASAEALPSPDPEAAARQTITMFRTLFG